MKYHDHMLSVGIEPYSPYEIEQLHELNDTNFLYNIIYDRKPIIPVNQLLKSCPF
jgi:hypothetical protein